MKGIMNEQVGATLSKVEQGSGNKQTDPIPVCKFQAKNWVMTYHNYPKDIFEQIEQALVPLCKWYVFGKEMGTKGKTPHIQGAFILKKKMRQSTLWNLLGTTFYLEKMNGKMEDQKYCIKEGLGHITNFKFPKPLKICKNLIGYQMEVLDLLKAEPNKRDIIWVYGAYQTGKTELCKYLTYHKIAFGPLEGNKRHILSVVGQHQTEEAFIIYLTADESVNQTKEFFQTLEKVKDGYFMSHFGTDGTYPVLMNSPHILVCANEPPDFDQTNMDPARFKVYSINSKTNKNCLNCKNVAKLGRKCGKCLKNEKSVEFQI